MRHFTMSAYNKGYHADGECNFTMWRVENTDYNQVPVQNNLHILNWPVGTDPVVTFREGPVCLNYI